MRGRLVGQTEFGSDAVSASPWPAEAGTPYRSRARDWLGCAIDRRGWRGLRRAAKPALAALLESRGDGFAELGGQIAISPYAKENIDEEGDDDS